MNDIDVISSGVRQPLTFDVGRWLRGPIPIPSHSHSISAEQRIGEGSHPKPRIQSEPQRF